MPSISDLFGPLGSAAQRAVSMLLEAMPYREIYAAIRSHFPSATQASIRNAINLGRQALAAVRPLGAQGRYRISDIPIIGPRMPNPPQLSGNLRFNARGLASWINLSTGMREYSTVYFTFPTLPSRAKIMQELRRQAIFQQQSSGCADNAFRAFDRSTLTVNFVAFTRAF